MNDTTSAQNSGNQMLFWGCFIALVTCAFGFVIRTQIVGDWATEFNLDETEKGRILAVALQNAKLPCRILIRSGMD